MPRAVNRRNEARLTHARLRELLHYDPDSGEFTWIKSASNRAPKGSRAGCYNDSVRQADGQRIRYVMLGIDGNLFLAHRVAWFYMTGLWPDEEIDHRDGDGWNNRWSNLREAIHQENMRNVKLRADNSTGVKGVCFYAKQNNFQAWLDCKYLGTFPTLAEATAAREAAARKSHGEFYRAGGDAGIMEATT